MLMDKETLRSNLSDLTENIALLISENEKLNEQIEKMKCCENCKYATWLTNGDSIFVCRSPKEVVCNDLDKWELKV